MYDKRPGDGRRLVSALAPVLMFLLAVAARAAPRPVVVEGFAPHGIDAATISYEFKRIAALLEAEGLPGTSPLTVTYFTKHGVGTPHFSLPEWGGGGAIGTDRIVVALDAEPFIYRDFLGTTVHELVHIAINRICTTTVVPRWFHEGVAMTLAGDITQVETIAISRAIFTGSLLRLSSIDSVNHFSRHRAQLAYAQSHQAVLFLVDTYGLAVLREILFEANRCGDFWTGVREVLQLSEAEVESMARSYLVRRFRFAFFFTDTYLLWIGATLLFLIGYGATRMRNARRTAAMQRQEEQEAHIEPGSEGTGEGAIGVEPSDEE